MCLIFQGCNLRESPVKETLFRFIAKKNRRSDTDTVIIKQANIYLEHT